MSQTTILCVDPNRANREATLADLRGNFDDAEVVSAASLSDAEDLLDDRAINCLVTEYEFPNGTGFDLVEYARGVEPDAGCILYATTDHDVLRRDSPEEVITEYVNKDAPGASDQLVELVRATVTFDAQTSYPLPQNEDERVSALESYDLDDEDLAESIEQITDLAAQYFETRRASVNVIKEHSQEFLACHGAEWTPTDREDSICTYALVEDDSVTVVEDTRTDPRFEDNEDLQDLDIRSYAGAELQTPDGLEIGTLCVYDELPREFTGTDVAFLETLADVAMDVIDLHHEVERTDGVADPQPEGETP